MYSDSVTFLMKDSFGRIGVTIRKGDLIQLKSFKENKYMSNYISEKHGIKSETWYTVEEIIDNTNIERRFISVFSKTTPNHLVFIPVTQILKVKKNTLNSIGIFHPLPLIF